MYSPIVYFFIHFLLKDNCFTEFCYFLSNLNINQPWVYIYPLPFKACSHLPPHPSPSRLIQSPCLNFLSHTANSHWLSILHTIIQVSMLLFPYILPSPPLSPCPYVYFLCLLLHCCLVNKFFSTIFLDSIYMHCCCCCC